MPATAEPIKKTKKYRLLAGGHTVGVTNLKANPPTRRREYNPGDVIETDRDLVKLFGAEKFMEVHEDRMAIQEVPTRQMLNRMTVTQLKRWAADEEVELPDGDGLTEDDFKQELITAIRASFGAIDDDAETEAAAEATE